MKCLTIKQPYAHLIAIGEKRVENRTWLVREKGFELAIHAGRNRGMIDEADELVYPDMVFGAIVAVAWCAGCIGLIDVEAAIRERPELEWLRRHEHVEGPVLWVLPQVKRLAEPIPMGGQLGLFTLPKRVEAAVQAGGAGIAGVTRNRLACSISVTPISDQADENQPPSPLDLPSRRRRVRADRGGVGGELLAVVQRAGRGTVGRPQLRVFVRVQ